MAECFEVRRNRHPGDEVERGLAAAFGVAGVGLADQRPFAQGHRSGRRAGERRALAPRLRDGAPHRTFAQDVDHQARVATGQVERIRPVPRAPHCLTKTRPRASGAVIRRHPGRGSLNQLCAVATARSGRWRAAAVAMTYAGPAPRCSTSRRSCSSLPGLNSSPPTRARKPVVMSSPGMSRVSLVGAVSAGGANP